VAVVAGVDDGVGSFTESSAYETYSLACSRRERIVWVVPWTYCRRTSSFICSAKSVFPSPGVVAALIVGGLFALRRDSAFALGFMVGFMFVILNPGPGGFGLGLRAGA
jgi:hypothetical protein